jgi:hypothetical protein
MEKEMDMTFIGFANTTEDLLFYLNGDYDIVSILVQDDGSYQVTYREDWED